MENKIEKYIRKMKENGITVQRMFHLSHSLIECLYERDILTFELMKEMRDLKRKPNGNADALLLIQKILYELGDKAAKPFLEALVHPETRLDALAMFIDPELAMELIKKRDDPEADSDSDAVGGPEVDRWLSVLRDDVDHFSVGQTNPNVTPVKEVETADVAHMSQTAQREEARDTEESWMDPPPPGN